MIQALIVDSTPQDAAQLSKKLDKYCPLVQVTDHVETFEEALFLIKKKNLQLVFLDVELPGVELGSLLQYLPSDECESIIVTRRQDYLPEALKFCVSGYLTKPVHPEWLQIAVSNAKRRICLKEECQKNKYLLEKMLKQDPGRELVGIPTMEGFDFFEVRDIVRCEGLQRCTRVITKSRTNIISSYNLGKFRQLLTPYGFYLTHKSHLLNLRYIRHYLREGTIILLDGTEIPVARGKKAIFSANLTTFNQTPIVADFARYLHQKNSWVNRGENSL